MTTTQMVETRILLHVVPDEACQNCRCTIRVCKAMLIPYGLVTVGSMVGLMELHGRLHGTVMGRKGSEHDEARTTFLVDSMVGLMVDSMVGCPVPMVGSMVGSMVDSMVDSW